MMRHLRLCGDDFALDTASTEGLLALLTQGRLSATSCLTESPLWPEAAQAARAANVQSSLGLHFNLTEGLTPDDQPLGNLLRNSLTGRIDQAAIARRLHQQLDLFEQQVGRPPAHVDGHQHVHVFPGIRGVLLSVLSARYRQSLPRLRAITPVGAPSDSLLKRLVLSGLGMGFAGQARRLSFPLNTSFAGAYSLTATDYPALFATWLERVQDGGEIMCHPAKGASDSHGAARQQEYDFLASDAFVVLLQEKQVTLAGHGPASAVIS